MEDLAKGDNMNKTTARIIIAVASALIVLCFVGCGSSASSASSSSSAASPSAQSSENSASTSASNASTSKQAVSSEAAQSSDSAKSDDTKDLRNALESKFNTAIFYDNVRNDSTGRWRCLVYDADLAPQDFALEYYQAYFASDDEIHALVNLRKQTTACVSDIGTDLDVTIHEYVDGEEHDAKELFSGAVISQYTVSKDSGAIEQVR